LVYIDSNSSSVTKLWDPLEELDLAEPRSIFDNFIQSNEIQHCEKVAASANELTLCKVEKCDGTNLGEAIDFFNIKDDDYDFFGLSLNDGFEKINLNNNDRLDVMNEQFSFVATPIRFSDDIACLKAQLGNYSDNNSEKYEKALDNFSQCLSNMTPQKSTIIESGLQSNIEARDELICTERKLLKSKSLSLRADVMNKNLFRAFRRECKTIYEDFLKINSLSNSRSKRIFKSNLKKFASDFLNSTTVNFSTRSGFNQANFARHLGTFINTCLMKKLVANTIDMDEISEFNNILYSYSHKKFYDYLRLPEVSVLMKMVFAKTSIEDFVAKHPTLNTN